jgi:hypothetical protein
MKKFMLCATALLLFERAAYSADFTCASGDTACLIAAINVANSNGEDNTIFLSAGEYILGVVNNNTDGPNGLPSITGKMSIRGADGIGSTIQRNMDSPGFRIFHVASEGNLTLDWLALTGGMSPAGGGAILNRGTLAIHRSTLSSNFVIQATAGGAILNIGTVTISHSEISSNASVVGSGGGIASSGSLVIEDSFIRGNLVRSGTGGGGISMSGFGFLLRTTVAGNNTERDGGGILNGGTLTIENSNIHGNESAEVSSGRGGGVFNSGVLTIISSTVSQNRSTFSGAGIFNSGDLFLTNDTVAQNQQRVLGGPAGLFNAGTARLQNTILALNTLQQTGMASDCNSFSSLGNNLIGSFAGCSFVGRVGDLVGDPLLGPFTEDVAVAGSGHYPLRRRSPAIDAANQGACTPRDQLGDRRVRECDIGAIEGATRVGSEIID